jgi:hypothetical protein
MGNNDFTHGGTPARGSNKWLIGSIAVAVLLLAIAIAIALTR